MSDRSRSRARARRPVRSSPHPFEPSRVGTVPHLALLLIAGLLSLLVVACGTAPETARTSAPNARVPRPTPHDAATAARPPLFRVDGGAGATLFLFGTVHLGPPEGWTFSSAALAALAEANTIALEVDLREADEETVSTIVANLALFEPGTQLGDRIQPETQRLLETHDETLTALGFPPRLRTLMKPWFLTLGILESQIDATGYVSEQAVDQQVFAAHGDRELIGLESIEQQFDFFETLPPELQDLILRDALSRLDDAANEIEDLVDAWRIGDEEALLRLSREGVETHPELEDFYAILIDGRNRSWVAKLERLLEAPTRQGGRVFVAVGAMHLVGPRGVPQLLREAGYRVEPIDQTETP